MIAYLKTIDKQLNIRFEILRNFDVSLQTSQKLLNLALLEIIRHTRKVKFFSPALAACHPKNSAVLPNFRKKETERMCLYHLPLKDPPATLRPTDWYNSACHYP